MTAVDGHGLRLIVFLQGCSKRCVFCCNPDSWSPSAGRWVTVGDVRRALAKNLAYYRRSGGGVTLSGGECLLQPEFCRAVCVMAHRLGVTAALDTAAAGVETQWRRLLPEVDVALVCVKSADPEKHARITQAHDQRPHRVLMAFLRACEDHGVKVWIRHVLMEARVEEGVEEEDERASGSPPRRRIRIRIRIRPDSSPNRPNVASLRARAHPPPRPPPRPSPP